MAAGPITQVADVIVPEIFAKYSQLMTAKKSNLVSSGVIARSSLLDSLMSQGGTHCNIPSFNDLDDDESRVSTDSVPAAFTGGVADPDPKKITSVKELAVYLNRNQSWSSAALAAQLANADPLNAIAQRVSSYWSRQLQNIFMSTMKGVFADNDANPVSTEHVKGDLTKDIKGAAFKAGETNFTTENMLEAAQTLGDSMDDISVIMMHSRVALNLTKQNLIQTIRDADNNWSYQTYMGRVLLINDLMPNNANIYETWLFGNGAVQLGMAAPKLPVEMHRMPGAGNGGGADVLYNRVRWVVHPVGHKYAGAFDNGGPNNATLSAAASWQRVYPERKQIKIARLITREA